MSLHWHEVSEGSLDGYSGDARAATVRRASGGWVLYLSLVGGGTFAQVRDTAAEACDAADSAWARSVSAAGLVTAGGHNRLADAADRLLGDAQAEVARLTRRIRAAESVLRGARLPAEEIGL